MSSDHLCKPKRPRNQENEKGRETEKDRSSSSTLLPDEDNTLGDAPAPASAAVPALPPTHSNDNDNPFLPMFGAFRGELDEHHDRRERVIKVSRDVTALSKKM